MVSVELTDFPSRHSQPLGRVVEVIGDIDDPGMEIEIAVRKYGVPHEFSDAALDAAAKLPDEVRPADIRHRVDLRDVPLVTIDGEDARDFDDAVYCEPMKVGRGTGFRLMVAIADVSHYVHPNERARRRCARSQHVGVFPAPRDSDAAGEAVERVVFAESASRPLRAGLRHGHHRARRRSRRTSSIRA